uniref:Uncharacterized protein n=1 Tax=Falco tinnunculus TaxID=100819 RepID=A0A8C4XVP1_FALTI
EIKGSMTLSSNKSGIIQSPGGWRRNYGGVYVGLPSDAAAMVSGQTKAAPKGIGRLRISFLLSQFNFI